MRDRSLLHTTAEYSFLDVLLCLRVKRFRRHGGTNIFPNVGNILPSDTRHTQEELNFHIGAIFIQHKRRD
jgi:hypothetical protein